ncbi:MAG: VTT domain-containing protein [Acidobacteria bacterium]|nr:VTT domain-containing protein [Acidobacteriota bacterium]
MRIVGQIRDKRRWLAAAGVCLLAGLAVYSVFEFLTPADYETLKAGLLAPESLGVERFSGLAVFFILAAATLVSEDLTCIAAGVLAAQGKIGLSLAISSCAFGIFVGDILLFLAGRFFGRRALNNRFFNYFVSESAFERSSRWLERQGMKAVFISRFVFGLRLPLYFAAGVLKTSFRRFTLYFSAAVAIWTPILVGATSLLGAEVVKNSLFNRSLWLGILVFAAAAFFGVRLVQQLLTWKGRRILLGRIKRRFIWEFWSIRVFYLPVVVYVLWLMVRRRSLTVFSCANPAIPASGFAGESKAAILDGLGRSAAAQPFSLKYLLLRDDQAAAERLQAATDFMNAGGLSFPVVVKPDVGERGTGVVIAKDPAKLEKAVADAKGDLILQEFAPGVETSVFYCRYPDDERGRIFSITEKRFPTVAGDGRRTLEELILADPRAVCLAAKYLERSADRLETVPGAGEIVPIVDIGTHSRGAIFRDGGWMKTPALEETIDRICRGFEGFYFGRFDIRAGSFEEFAAGENFRIVELNGVTSESTNIYDPRYSLFAAYRILFSQWRIAFEIGAANRRRGVRPASLAELIGLALGRPARRPETVLQDAECA